MSDIAKSIFGAPVSTLLILAGIIFLLIAVVGNISGKIEPGPRGRLGAGVVGFLCMVIGIWLLPRLPVPDTTHQREQNTSAAGSSPDSSSGGTTAPQTSVLSSQPSSTGPSSAPDNPTAAATQKVKYGRLQGRVTNEEGAAFNVTIELANETAYSDRDLGGLYAFPKVGPGIYNVTVKRAYMGNGEYSRPQIIYRVPIQAGKRTWLNIVTSKGDDLQEVVNPQIKIDDAVHGGPMPK